MCDKSTFYLLPVLFLTICWNIPKFFELQTCYLPVISEGNITQLQINHSSQYIGENTYETEAMEYPQVCATELRDSYTYCRDYLLIANFIMMALIPFLLLSIFNFLTFRTIQKSTMNNVRTTKRQRRDHGIARMFLLITFVFFLCNTPRIVLNTWEVRMFDIF